MVSVVDPLVPYILIRVCWSASGPVITVECFDLTRPLVTMTNLTDVLNPSSGNGLGLSDAIPTVSGANPLVAIADNPRGYPPFELRLVPTYTNRQLRYYHVSRAILNVDKEELKRKIDDRKEILDLISWDGNTRENTLEANTSLISSSPPPPPHSISRTLSLNANNEEDSEYPKPPPRY